MPTLELEPVDPSLVKIPGFVVGSGLSVNELGALLIICSLGTIDQADERFCSERWDALMDSDATQNAISALRAKGIIRVVPTAAGATVEVDLNACC